MYQLLRLFQSSQWEKFQKLEGRETFNLSNDYFQALIIKYPLPLGKNYLCCPRGPIWLNENNQANQKSAQLFLAQAQKLVCDQNSIFLRIGNLDTTDLNLSVRNFRPAPSNYFYSGVFFVPAEAVLDIQPNNEIIFQKMKSKTRYNIRLSLRKDLTLVSGHKDKLDEFYALTQETGRRDHFSPHLKVHYQHLLEAFGQQSRIYLVRFRNKTLAAGLYVFANSTAYYLHGASSSEHRNLMPTYFLHWQIIQEAKKRNCQFYNFGGVSPQKENSPWPGVDQFKYNFGAKKIIYPWANDLINQLFWYRAYLISRSLRRKIRHL